MKVLPRWLVLVADMLCVVTSLALIVMLGDRTLPLNQYPQQEILLLASGVILINGMMFFVFRTYTGMIRYTNVEVISRFLTVNLLVSCSYFVFDVLLRQMHPGGVFSPFVVGFNFLLVNSLLIGYRLAIRRVFELFRLRSADKSGRREKALVYGLSEESLHIGRMLNGASDSPWVIAGFLDSAVSGKRIQMGTMIPVYQVREAQVKKLRAAGITVILVPDCDVDEGEMLQLVDLSMKVDMEIRRVPSVRSWVSAKARYHADPAPEDLLGREPVCIQTPNCHAEEITGRVVLVTGAAGSIGSELVRQLVRCKPELIVLCDCAETPLHELLLEMQDAFRDTPVKGYLGSVRDEVRMRRLFEDFSPDIVFHAAAYKHVPLMEENPSLAVLNNVAGTRMMAELSVAYGVSKFVMISTDKAVNPTNIMGATKRISEIFVQSYFHHLKCAAGDPLLPQHVTRFITTRFGNVLGSNGSVIGRFQQQIKKGGPLTVTHPDVSRYFMTISEACSLVLEAAVMGKGGEIFVFDMGRPVRIVDLARRMIRMSSPAFAERNVQIAYTGLRPGEKLYEELLNKEEDILPTYHEKIMIARARMFDFEVVKSHIDKLIAAARRNQEWETVMIMKSLLPEYTSSFTVREAVS